jgi:surface polysaccharide O-acyltransferase-like enzyme
MRPPSTIQPALLSRSLRIFYALVIWTYAFLGMRALAGDMSNAGGSWHDLLQAPLPPFAHFWFLWALLINIILFAILRLGMRSILPDLWFWTVATIVSVAVNFTVSLPQQFAPWLGPALNYSFVFTVGGLIGSSHFVRATPSLTIASLGSLLFVFFLWASMSIELPINRVASGLVLSLLLLLPVITISTHLGRSGGGRALAFLGVISLAIYVIHTIFSAGIRIALINGGYFNLHLHLVMGISAGILGPLLVYLAARRANMLRILGLA